MAIYKLFDLGGPDLEAADVDHILDAVNDEHVTFVVHRADVARMEPAAAQRAGAVFRAAPVALHDAGAFDANLAPPPERHFLVVLTEDFQLEVLDGRADAAELVAKVVVVAGERRRLGEAIALVDRPSEALGPTARDLLRHGGRGGEVVADGGQVP